VYFFVYQTLILMLVLYSVFGCMRKTLKCMSLCGTLLYRLMTALSPDPNGLLSFMVAQLQAAEDAKQRVWIIGHIPSGKADFSHDQVWLTNASGMCEAKS
jgi:hypothetical protein